MRVTTAAFCQPLRQGAKLLCTILLCTLLTAQSAAVALVEQLGSADNNTRTEAFQALQKLRSPEVAELLTLKLAGMNAASQQLGFLLMEQQSIDIARGQWLSMVAADSPVLRAAAAAHLWRLQDHSHATTLATALLKIPPQAVLMLLNFVWGIDDPQVLAALRRFVARGQPSFVVKNALQHLIQVENPRNEATVLAANALLDTEDIGLRVIALASLIAMGETQQSMALAEILIAKPGQTDQVIPLLLKAAKLEPVLVDALIQRLKDAPHKFQVTQIASLLQIHASEKTVAVLFTLLDQEDPEIHSAALSALTNIPSALDKKRLKLMLTSTDASQQLIAAKMLRRMDDTSGLPYVLDLLTKNVSRKAEATKVLAEFRSRQVGLPLINLLDDPEQPVREAAWNGLQDLMRDLFPYRQFDFAKAGYEPNSNARGQGIAMLRAWWEAALK